MLKGVRTRLEDLNLVSINDKSVDSRCISVYPAIKICVQYQNFCITKFTGWFSSIHSYITQIFRVLCVINLSTSCTYFSFNKLLFKNSTFLIMAAFLILVAHINEFIKLTIEKLCLANKFCRY